MRDRRGRHGRVLRQDRRAGRGSRGGRQGLPRQSPRGRQTGAAADGCAAGISHRQERGHSLQHRARPRSRLPRARPVERHHRARRHPHRPAIAAEPTTGRDCCNGPAHGRYRGPSAGARTRPRPLSAMAASRPSPGRCERRTPTRPTPRWPGVKPGRHPAAEAQPARRPSDGEDTCVGLAGERQGRQHLQRRRQPEGHRHRRQARAAGARQRPGPGDLQRHRHPRLRQADRDQAQQHVSQRLRATTTSCW